MRKPIEVLRDVRTVLGLGDITVNISLEDNDRRSLLYDVQELKNLNQIANFVFRNYLTSLGENPNDYNMLSGLKK